MFQKVFDSPIGPQHDGQSLSQVAVWELLNHVTNILDCVREKLDAGGRVEQADVVFAIHKLKRNADGDGTSSDDSVIRQTSTQSMNSSDQRAMDEEEQYESAGDPFPELLPYY